MPARIPYCARLRLHGSGPQHLRTSALLRAPLLATQYPSTSSRQLHPHASSFFSTSSSSSASVISSLAPNVGSRYKSKRVGRGPGSGKGKTSGRGHKGQKQHGNSLPAGFEGGQTTLATRLGKRGFVNRNSENMAELNLDKLQIWIDQGRLNPNKPITMVELHKSGCISSIRDGIKVLSRGKEHLKQPVHLIVSRVSSGAVEAIEAAGGTVTTRYYTPFAIKAILQLKMHPVHSSMFSPTPITQLVAPIDRTYELALPDPTARKDLEYYRDVRKRGYLSYMVRAGQGPSLYWKTPGLGGKRSPRAIGASQKDAARLDENQLW